MAFEANDFVEWEGYISDESSFLGDDETKERLEAECAARNPLKSPQWKYRHRDPNVLAAKGKAAAEEVAREKRDEEMQSTAASPHVAETGEKSKYFAVGSREHVIDLTKLPKRTTPQFPSPSSDTPKLFNRREGDADARQLHESIAEFTQRLPVSSRIEDVGPWIWIENPHQRRIDDHMDVPKFQELGRKSLAKFTSDCEEIVTSNQGKGQATISRKIAPLREELRDDIERLAREYGVLSGKWMLFPNSEDLPRTWRLVAEGVADNRLGCAAKVGTIGPDTDTNNGRLICVYTKDFNDMEDILKVMHELIDLNLVNSDRGIYYKMDAYTYLDIAGKNEYGLRASKYGSRELLATSSPQKRSYQQTNRPRKRQMTLEAFQR
ncbi:DUF1917-domain-containing protein [Pseudovirgaria hyperparasitica]|uniref:DUF1917-domain-containing protein n=1 Tax=Pseudovirgaria hyperparasitica TaxID=470096 RepID=A0A6A6WB78_9PEZI|nr:DUF1917-domain-containing protein [Pseudovirgaria hyperparasitica]KAF2760098.1 DUF1917-domain-containing protein [Pseudovirgaria hyperparasitica]